MRLSQILFSVALAAPALLAGCAGHPSADALAAAPVVRFGEATPAKGDFILLYPAGAPLPVTASVTGSLLQQDVSAPLTARVNRDVYLYKHWVSFDGKIWVDGEKAIASQFRMELPGGRTGREPGELSAQFDLR